jgi:hypothetical protein
VELRVTARLPDVCAGGGAAPVPSTPLLQDAELRFALGCGAAPFALEAAVSSMRPGERCAVWCSPACALAPAAALPQLPSAAPDGVQYALHLRAIVQVRDLHGDGSLLKRRTVSGVGDFPVDCPLQDCRVRCRIATYAAGALLAEEEEAEFELATGAQPPGLEAALRLMLPGERARVTAAARHAYDAAPPGRWARPAGLPAGAAVEWELQLLSFERPVNWYQAEPEAILAEAAAAKEAGVALFREGKWALARARFEALAAKLAGLRGLEGEEEATATALRAACLLNAAAAAQRAGEHAVAAARCTEVLAKVDAGSAKAHYRRAVSRTALGEWEGAREDLEAACAADESAKQDCDKQAARLRAAQRAATQHTRQQLDGFLTRTPAAADAAAAELAAEEADAAAWLRGGDARSLS